MVVIRPLAAEGIALVEQHLPSCRPDAHRWRFECQQQGSCLYLIAWEGGVPVGHLAIEWGGTTRVAVRSALPRHPELSGFGVRPDRRSRGIGSQLMDVAERLVAGRGYERVGLSVALVNIRARSLYERRGYRDAGLDPLQARIYLVKDLRRPTTLPPDFLRELDAL